MKERKINIEFIRVFAIMMTIMIHISNIYVYSFNKISSFEYLVAVTYNAISRICVPLFFMVSGIFLIKEEYDKKKYINRVVKFLIILIIWSIIYYLINNNFSFNNFGVAFFNSLFNANETSRHLWFMYAIIGIYIALPFIQNMCKNLTKEQENLFLILWMTLSGLIVIIVPLARFITKSQIDIEYPIPIINAAYYLGYFISGHILYERFKNVKKSNKYNLKCVLIFILSTLITICVTYFYSIKNNSIFDSMLWYRSIFTILSAFSIFILVVINENKIKSKFILSLSKLSFGIYLVHYIFIIYIKRHYNILDFNDLLFIPIITIIIYLLSLGTTYVLKKIPYVNKIV